MTTSWIKTGAWAGIISILCYLTAIFAPLPDQISLVLVFHFGILLSLGFYGLSYDFITQSKSEIPAILMRYAGLIAGALVTTMLVVQQSLFMEYDTLIEKASDADKLLMKQTGIMPLLNTVHFGLDIAWDLYISWTGILLGIAMYLSEKYNNIVAAYFFVLHLLLLVFNLYTFPIPPGDAGLIDLGPFVAISYLLMFVYLLIRMMRKK